MKLSPCNPAFRLLPAQRASVFQNCELRRCDFSRFTSQFFVKGFCKGQCEPALLPGAVVLSFRIFRGRSRTDGTDNRGCFILPEPYCHLGLFLLRALSQIFILIAILIVVLFLVLIVVLIVLPLFKPELISPVITEICLCKGIDRQL